METELASEMAEQTQAELNHYYGDTGYDGQINAVNRHFQRGGRRGTRPWGRGGGFGGSGGVPRVPFIGNPEGTHRLTRNNDGNDYAAQKAQGMCFRCGSGAHIVKHCPYTAVPNNNPRYFTGNRGNRRGKFRTFQRRKKFNSMGVFVGTEDISGMYDSETGKFEELPDTTHDETLEREEAEINVVNENTYGNVEYLGEREDEINIDAYFHKQNI